MDQSTVQKNECCWLCFLLKMYWVSVWKWRSIFFHFVKKLNKSIFLSMVLINYIIVVLLPSQLCDFLWTCTFLQINSTFGGCFLPWKYYSDGIVHCLTLSIGLKPRNAYSPWHILHTQISMYLWQIFALAGMTRRLHLYRAL